MLKKPKTRKTVKSLNAADFQILLTDLGACEEAVTWASGKSLNKVWKTCERGDWLLWLCGKMADKPNWPTRKQVVLAACACVETSLQFVPVGEKRPRTAIETARKWARGLATIDEVRNAASAASAAYAAANAAYAADAAYAAYAAAYAAYAADAASAASAAYAAANAAREKTLKELAVLVRSILKPKAVQ